MTHVTRVTGLIIVVCLIMLVMGCTTIDRVNVNTVAVNCDIDRGEGKAVTGDANANVLSQSGAAAGEFVGNLRSNIRCRDIEVEAETTGEVQ